MFVQQKDKFWTTFLDGLLYRELWLCTSPSFEGVHGSLFQIWLLVGVEGISTATICYRHR